MPPIRGERKRPVEAGGQEVSGDAPGDEERYPGRVVGVCYEAQRVEDAAGREDARGVDDEGEDARDETRQQRQGEAEDEAWAGAFPAAAPQEQGAAEYGGRDEPGEQADAHVNEGESGQVALAALSSLQDQEHERLGEERLDEHEAGAVGGPYSQETQEDHGPSAARLGMIGYWLRASVIMSTI